jgi:ABC-type multidrug transport system fused ATPase/permease subunit
VIRCAACLDHPGVADHRSAGRLLWWLAKGQWRTLVMGMLFGIAAMSTQAVMPAVIGRAIDLGVADRDTDELVKYAGLMFPHRSAAGDERDHAAPVRRHQLAHGLVELPLEELRGHVALVTQEHHVFGGTLRENLALAAPAGAIDEDIRCALDAVDALGWVDALPGGFDTVVGSGGRVVTAAQAQQIALARLVLADPHTLVLDEATSLTDPRAARHLERSLAAVLDGRVAVVEDGRIEELGTHDEPVAAGGSYAALWDSWNGRHGTDLGDE